MSTIEQQRRRLTVSKCDPVKDGGAGGGGAAADRSLAAVKEILARKSGEAGSRAAYITSATDRDLKRRRSFSDKDQTIFKPPSWNDDAQVKDWFKSLGVAFTCKKGLKPESPNQDSFTALVVEGEFALYGVYDGHGPCGHDVSQMAHEVLSQEVLTRMKNGASAGDAFSEAFVECQKIIERTSGVDSSTSGSTCTMAHYDMKTKKLTIAHVGDSRSVLKARDGVTQLTIDHKPDLPEEKKRIESSNPPGRVVFDGFYNHRVFAQGGMYPGLNMSRALGDVIAHKEAGLTAKPDIKVVDVTPGTTLLICSDGVWEFIENAESYEIIAKRGGANEQKVETLAKEAWDRWMNDSDHEICDDITVLQVVF